MVKNMIQNGYFYMFDHLAETFISHFKGMVISNRGYDFFNTLSLIPQIKKDIEQYC